MALKEHSVEQVDIPDLKPKASTTDILKKFISESITALRAEIAHRRNSLKSGERDLILAYEHLELAGIYVNRSEDMSPYDVMKVMKEDSQKTKDLFKRTHPELD